MEKVINEFKVIETDDGFRIEIKGNKETIRRILRGFDPNSSFSGPFGRGFGFSFGPFSGGFAGGSGAWKWSGEEEKKVPDPG